MGAIRLDLLGEPHLERDGTRIALDTRKATALLAYLALAGPQRREALALLLWPDSDAEHGRGALRRTLSALRTALAGEGLLTAGTAVTLDPAVQVDAIQFRLLRQQGSVEALEAAVALHRGELLAGFALRDSEAFEEWRAAEAGALRRELTAALEALVERCADAGAHEPALLHARRWLTEDPLNERAHRALMSLHAARGDRAAAVAQYRECVRLLERELAVTPLAETTALYRSVVTEDHRHPGSLAASEGGTAVVTPRGRLPTPGHLPIVGRDAERDALVAAASGAAQLILIEGEAGIGKSRLLDELIERVRARRGVALVSRCDPGARDLAYAPAIEWLRAALMDARAGWPASLPSPVRGEAARLLPELADATTTRSDDADGPPEVARARFLDALALALLEASGGPVTGILALEDAQWADDATLDLLRNLTYRAVSHPCAIVVTTRPEDLAADHRLRTILAAAERHGRLARVTLGRLDGPAVDRLVSSALPSAAPELLARLREESEGLPLLVIERLRALASNAASDQERWALPRRIRDLVQARLAGLSETARQLAGAAAVLGRGFEPELVRAVSGRSDDEAATALDELVARGVTRPADAGSGYEFMHGRVRDAVYEEIGLGRRRLLHRRAAKAIARRCRGQAERDAAAGALARHYAAAGLEAEAAEQHAIAAGRARALFATTEAITHARAALALGHPEAPTLGQMVGELALVAGRYDDALEAFERAASLGGGVHRAEAGIAAVHDRRGAYALALHHHTAAFAALPQSAPPAEAAPLLAAWALTAHHAEHRDEADTLSRRALAAAEVANDPRPLAQAYNVAAVVAAAGGHIALARDHLGRSLAAATLIEDPGPRIAALNNLALLDRADGDVAHAAALTREALSLCVRMGDRHREAMLRSNLADVLQLAGDTIAAQAELRQALLILAELGSSEAPETWAIVEW